MKSPRAVRATSLEIARNLEYEINTSLPLLNEYTKLRPEHETIERALALHAVIACSYKFDASKTIEWVTQESLTKAMTLEEYNFITKKDSPPPIFQSQVEGLWALSWALRVVPILDFSKTCDNNLVQLLPNLKIGENSTRFRAQASLRSLGEIVSACDLAYCLHWSVNQALLSGTPVPGKIPARVVIERRRALEWLLSDEKWNTISLDT